MVLSLMEANSTSHIADSVLRLLESYFPTDRFLIDANGVGVNQCPTSTEEFESLLHQCVINFLQTVDGKLNVDEFLEFIRAVEPFSTQWTYTESYVRKNTAKKWGMGNGF
ncbi:hypothetical protein [Pseudomonas sp. SLFW]|uniref:hypothetical protein n=1 Tax=Pseudomonas sp. SLFW TaxID=2683259 RepID=UPI0014128564|nr:hypothetical protein [Pseudomonas sp. SLFW]NBB12533.1 hypothetical protein [Pseudomonas sp. SLFW]